MRKIALLVAVMASLLITTVSALADENSLKPQPQLSPKKDVCLLFAMNCQDNAYAIQQRIDRLQSEIFKGTTVYSHDELNILQKKLDDAYKSLEFLYKEGA
jgi:hypothetical protein